MERWPDTYVGVRYTDRDAGVAWLERVYGFTVIETISVVVVMASPGGGICVVSSLDGPPAGEHVRTPSISMAVPDVDAHHEHAARGGARILMPPTDLPWGVRAYATLDLGGHHWQLFEHRP